MKKLLFILALALIVATASAQSLIPLPAQYQNLKGRLTLSRQFAISCPALPDSIRAEAARFASIFQTATGYRVTVTERPASLIRCQRTDTAGIGSEGYRLSIGKSGVSIQSATATGFFYAFQTLRMLLPANVMAGQRDASVKQYTLPYCRITDRPRFGYRGFMLDVSRHFFTVREVKRMLDVMACYKMNRFHWHLTDDQGWRIEIKKYPRLTSVGSIRQGSNDVDPKTGPYFVDKPYGPYFYTQEEVRDVVRYARQLHIEVVPEIDLPGHCCAAMTAYPEYSCTPSGEHRVQNDGGVYSDILNVANPQAVRFAEDILDELIPLFPYPYIHIGGDECPVAAWKQNNLCNDLYNQIGATDYRELQSRFTHELAQYMSQKSDPSARRHLICWNETVSSKGSDTTLLRGDGLTIMCWIGAKGAAHTATRLGMNNVITDYGYYYINRRQSRDADEPQVVGKGTDDLEHVYNYRPLPDSTFRPSDHPLFQGVQATFWTERVSSDYLLEYLALPRLLAIAEAAWTPQSLRHFDGFKQRLQHHAAFFQYGGYAYGKHYFQKK